MVTCTVTLERPWHERLVGSGGTWRECMRLGIVTKEKLRTGENATVQDVAAEYERFKDAA